MMENVSSNAQKDILNIQMIKPAELFVKMHPVKLVTQSRIFVLSVFKENFFIKELALLSARSHCLVYHKINHVLKNVGAQVYILMKAL